MRAPIISLARLILAPNPYILEGQLTVGMTQDNGIPVLFARPVIEVKSGPESNIKASSQLMIAEDSCLNQIAPFSASEHPAFSMVESVKRVRVDEGANTRRTIRDILEIPVTVLSSLQLSPTKSILKKTPEPPPPEPQATFDATPYARIFYDIGRQVPKLGNAPAAQVSNVLIANRSHNSLRLVPNPDLLPLQHLEGRDGYIFPRQSQRRGKSGAVDGVEDNLSRWQVHGPVNEAGPGLLTLEHHGGGWGLSFCAGGPGEG